MEIKVNKFEKQICACCGFFTINENHDICPVCFWEQDFFQEKNINDNGGPNTVSLIYAKENFKKFKAIETRFIKYVRIPREDEKPPIFEE